MEPFLIVNPASANGRTGRRFDKIARTVRSSIGEFEWAFTKCRGDAAVLAREVERSPARLVVAVGGDGTASEVIDGLVEGGRPGRPELTFGHIPRGTGGDLRRSVGFSANTARAARALVHGEVRAYDLGRVEFLGHDGKTQVRHFANVADFGVSGQVVAEVEGGWKAFGGRFAFMAATAKALWRYRDQPIRYRLDGGPWREDTITAFCVCNGKYFGGGMLVSPFARMDDGLFDITLWRKLTLSDFLTKKRMLYDGSHVTLPNTRCFRAREVEAEPLNGARVLLDVDGEQPGLLPARFTILPRALKIKASS
jgi:diacylglycerol kinase (ATP)